MLKSLDTDKLILKQEESIVVPAPPVASVIKLVDHVRIRGQGWGYWPGCCTKLEGGGGEKWGYNGSG